MRKGAIGAASLMVFGLLTAAQPASAILTTYDLKNDWRDCSNPNGPWSYQQGTSRLPSDSDWTPLSTTFPEYNPSTGHITQLAWAPGNTTGHFLPSWFKSKVNVASGSSDWNADDVVVHMTDPANG